MYGLNFFNYRPFKKHYHCFSCSMLPGPEREELELGGKIIMPPSAISELSKLNVVYPMLFKLTNMADSRATHCGVLEFIADESRVYIPRWMMHNLGLSEGGLVALESAHLPAAAFAKFKPLSADFLDLADQKAVLESGLRRFACLTAGDVIVVHHGGRRYGLDVLETRPADAVCVIDCDLSVEFSPPVGYEEAMTAGVYRAGVHDAEDKVEEQEPMDLSELMAKTFAAFSGEGNRLDGKEEEEKEEGETVRPRAEYVRGIPDYDYQAGTLSFIRWRPKEVTAEENGNKFEAFQGKGNLLGLPARAGNRNVRLLMF